MAASNWQIEECRAGKCYHPGELCKVTCVACGHCHYQHRHHGKTGGCGYGGNRCPCRGYVPEEARA